jgi:hypothetical protein
MVIDCFICNKKNVHPNAYRCDICRRYPCYECGTRCNATIDEQFKHLCEFCSFTIKDCISRHEAKIALATSDTPSTLKVDEPN